MDLNDNNGKGFLGDSDSEIENEISKIKTDLIKIDNKEKLDLTDEDKEKMLKELQAETTKVMRELGEKFDVWYGNNKDYLMREYVGEHQKEFRNFCGKIFMEDEEEEKELTDEDLGI